jgi:hypothetical protein
MERYERERKEMCRDMTRLQQKEKGRPRERGKRRKGIETREEEIQQKMKRDMEEHNETAKEKKSD